LLKNVDKINEAIKMIPKDIKMERWFNGWVNGGNNLFNFDGEWL
jgi:hypothetical protein